MYTLCVGAMFRNESHCMKEWLEHYLFHGVEHFYLINDRSTDNSVEILKEYIDRGIVELFHTDRAMYWGRQQDCYNEFILPRVHEKEMKWLLMVDFDEFVWSPKNIDLKDTLKQLSNYKQIQVGQTIFGSNGHITQPKSLVAGFTKYGKDPPTNQAFKYFIQTDVEYNQLQIHVAKFKDSENYRPETFVIIFPEWFTLNHYNCQSRNHWETVKMTRGDSDNWKVRTIEMFNELDLNDIEDTRLLEQNKSLLASLDNVHQ